jgi:hypothetical protein
VNWENVVTDRIAAIRTKLAAANKSLRPVLTADELAAFEHRHGGTLPAEFRRFLAEVGNGGDGPPEYGLVPLGNDPEGEQYWRKLPDVRKPFPFTAGWCWEDGEKSTEGTKKQARHGCVCLGTDGCGMDWVIVVTGPARGQVWQVCGEGVVPTEPRRDFLTWYADWLDGVDDWFG